MNIEALRMYCMSKDGVEESFPFDETTLVFKARGKIFCLAALDAVPLRINLKCDPERAVELREQYDAIRPGYHMNKTHWNTVALDGSIPARLVREMIDGSYDLIASPPRKKRKSG